MACNLQLWLIYIYLWPSIGHFYTLQRDRSSFRMLCRFAEPIVDGSGCRDPFPSSRRRILPIVNQYRLPTLLW